MNKLLLAAFCLVAVAAAIRINPLDKAEVEIRRQFDEFVLRYNKPYLNDRDEYERRLVNFKASLERAANTQKKDKHARYGVNKFSDLSQEEFQRTRLSSIKVSGSALARSCLANGVEAPHYDVKDVPTSWDWRTKNIINPVKDQGQCGSCWAFSTIGVIESQWALKGNPLTEFSEQLLVDCSQGCCMEEGQQVCNSGCDGGWQWNAFQDIMAWGGVALETAVPYIGEDEACELSNVTLTAKISNYTCISSGGNAADEDQMAAYCYANGPIAIAINADLLEDYTDGVIDPWFPSYECDPTELDHALIIVGWDQETDDFGSVVPYWIVRNSWGADWGENGYFRIARGSGLCGINNAVSAVEM